MGDLARACGIDQAGLVITITEWNGSTQHGEDPAFGRGSTPYIRLQGDPEKKPTPNVATIETGSYFAAEVVLGSFGTFAGLKIDGVLPI
ncbi:FAD-binding protein [Celeribacter sp.]|uniref:FAD-binding protein n=1 Tax=Celeribacter sp. TaxID=1890673 RepID=UPI003A8E1BF0